MGIEDSTVIEDLIAICKSPVFNDRVVRYQSGEELEFLNSWIENTATVEEPVQTDLSISEMIESCSRCAGDVVKKFSIGTGQNGVMIILNSPRLVNKTERMVFKKESTELLRKIITSIDLNIHECYITNVIKCEIDDSILQPSKIVSNCINILEKEMESIKPSVVIVFGDIIPLQKIVKESGTIDWFNVEHPITLIKNPELKRSAWNTLKVVVERLKES